MQKIKPLLMFVDGLDLAWIYQNCKDSWMNAIALSKRELSELTVAEEIIEKHQKSFLEVGAALVAIRDGKLYRAEHGTFEEYVDKRWKWTRQRAYQLIEASSVSENVKHVLQNPRQAAEVAKAPIEKQKAVVESATKKAELEGKKTPTTKHFKAAVEELEYEDIDDDEDELDLPVQISEAELAVANASIGQSIVQKILDAMKILRGVKEVPGTELLVARERSIMRELESVRNSVQVTMPKAVCPRCSGERCPQCGQMGWVNAVMAKELGA